MKLADLIHSNKALAIASRLDSGKAINLTKSLIKFLKEKGIKVYPEARIANIVGYLGQQLNDLHERDVPVIIAVGGDGTILRVAQSLSINDPPAILGINVGAVGFLAEFDMGTEQNSFESLITSEYVKERCMRLICTIEKTEKLPLALNEVLVITSRPSKALSVVIKINGEFYSSGYVDGIVISTPTGSTAYSLSAGGSIIVPELNLIQIVPVCPFARSGLKPLIVSVDSVIEIELLRPKLSAIVAIDGQKEFTISPSRKIIIKKSNHYINCLRSKNLKKSFFHRLNNKLLPGAIFPVPKHDSPEE
ncbi:MAG: NAD(+)/NADH kinase [Promethearchaeota archaeon]